MKFELGPPPQEAAQSIVHVWLECHHGSIQLMAQRADGSEKSAITGLDKYGHRLVFAGVDESLGLQLDVVGRVKRVPPVDIAPY